MKNLSNMGLTTTLKKLFGGKESTSKSKGNSTDTSNYLTKNPDKKLKVRTIDATRDAKNLASNTLKQSATQATKTASRANDFVKDTGNKTVEVSDKIINGMKEKVHHAFE